MDSLTTNSNGNDDKLELIKKVNKERVKLNKKIIAAQKKRKKIDQKHSKKMFRIIEGNVKLIGAIVISLSIVFYLFTGIINGKNTDNSLFWNNIASFTLNAGNVFFTIGIGSILLEVFGFAEYFRKRIRDTIIQNDYFDILSMDTKLKIKNQLEQSILFPGIDVDKDNLFSIIKNEIEPLLKDYYYEEYITNVECTINGSIITKKIKRRIVVSKIWNEDIEIDISSFFITLLYSNTIKEAEDSYKLLEVCVYENDEIRDMTNECNIVYTEINGLKTNGRDNYKYSGRLNCTEKITLSNEDIIFCIETETNVPIDDYYYIQRVNKPCKNFTIHFHYINTNAIIEGEGFGFMLVSSKDKIVYQKLSNCLIIRFTDWILPGDGVVYTILKKV